MKGRWKKLTAAFLCGVILCTNVGVEQAVRVQAAENAEVLEDPEMQEEETGIPMAGESDQDNRDEDGITVDDGGGEPREEAGAVEEKDEKAGVGGGSDAEDETGNDLVEPQENVKGESTVVLSGNCGKDGDNVKFVLDSDGALTISGIGEMESYELPSESKNAPWYEKRTSVKTVIIETGVTGIGSYAFNMCSGLINISIPEGVTSIGFGAFNMCSSLISISLPDGVTSIGKFAFDGCHSLISISLPDGVTCIDFAAFIGCNGLKSISLPEGVTVISSHAFLECSGLKSISLPDSVMSISDRAFQGCSSLISINLPNNVTSIDAYAFYKCLSLTTIRILNPACTIYDSTDTLPQNATIYGYPNSTAEAYAKKYNRIFKPLNSVEITKDMAAEDILNSLDLGNLINNISLSGTDIHGPTVTIAGKTFNLFTVPASVDIKLGDKVQAKIDEEEKTIQVLIGFDDFSGSAKLDPSENSSAYWSESYKQVKSLYTGVTGDKVDSTELWNQFSKLRGRLKKTNCSMGISASASAAGYIEFNYASGEIVYSNGGVILEANFDVSKEYKLPPCPAVYVTFGVSAGFDGKLSLIRESTLNYTPAINAGVDLTAILGVGAGSKRLKTYAEIGLKGTLGVRTSIPANTLEDALLVNLTAYAYFKSQVFGFDGPDWGPEEFKEIQLYPASKSKSFKLFNGHDLAEFDLSTAVPSERSYLNMSEALSLDAENILYFRSNVYPYNALQLICLDDGTMLLIWIDDNGDKSNVNKTSLMYSVYNGSSWSEAETIDETGGANDYPSVCSDGKKVQIVWQKAAKLPDDAGLPDVLKSVELYTVTYQNRALENAMAITSENSVYEMMQSIAVNGNQMAVAWMENSENDPFQAEGTNTIKVSRYVDGKWLESTVSSSQAEVSNLNASYVGTDLVITYESVIDGGNIISIIKGDTRKDIEGYGAEVSEGILYYCTDEGLMAYNIEGETTENVLPAAMGDCIVLDNGIEKMILATEYTGFTSELTAYIFDRMTGTWSDKVTLTHEGKYIREYSPVLDSNGNLSVAVNLVDVDENNDDIYGNAELRVINFSDTEDLIMEKGAWYNKDLLIGGGKLPLNFRVTNNGTKKVSEINVDILDSDGQILQSGAVACSVGIGESVDISYVYMLPDIIVNQVLTIKAYAENETDLSNNTVSVEIGEADIAIGNLYLSKGTEDTVVLKGEVKNIGYKKVPETTVAVYDKNEEGEIIGTAKVGELDVSAIGTFEVTVPEIYLDVNPLASGNVLYVVASAELDEMDYENNSKNYLIQSAIDEPFVMNFREIALEIGEKEKLEIAFSKFANLPDETVLWESSDESVVTVADGVLTAIGAGRATVTAIIGKYTAACTVNVREVVAITGIYLEESSVRLSIGESRQLVANVLPENASNQKMIWQSTNNDIVAVDENGLINAAAAGEANIIVYTEDGNKTSVCKVTVIQSAAAIYKITFSGGDNVPGENPSTLSGTAGTRINLPENSYTKEGYTFGGWTDGDRIYAAGTHYQIPQHDVVLTAVWSEKGKAVYTISSSAWTGGSIIPDGDVTVSEGDRQKFVIAADDGYHISDVKVDGKSLGVISEYSFESVLENHTIEVLFDKNAFVQVKEIRLNQTEAMLQKGMTLQLEATVVPENAEGKQLIWVSDNPEVASVSNEGLVTARSVGSAVITVTAGEVSVRCMVTVKDLQENPDDPTQPTYMITFDLQGKGAALPEYTGADYKDIKKGSKVKEPTAPTADGYIFTGWYKDSACTALWDFALDTVNENTTLYAGWKEAGKEPDDPKEPDNPGEPDDPIQPDNPAQPSYTMAFDLRGKGTALPDYTSEAYTNLKKGSTVKEPAAPTADGYIFTGWYKDSACTVLWDFTKDTVEEDTTLYAGWTPESEYEGILSGDTLAAGSRDGFWVAAIKEQTYTGKAIKPEVHVYDQEKRLEEGWDYTLTYKNNVKVPVIAGKKVPSVTVKGTGNYKGTTYTVAFVIGKATLDESHLAYTAVHPKGKAYTPAVIREGVLLKAKTDYVLTYENNTTGKVTKKVPTKEGSYTMHISGRGSCTGEFSVPYEVTVKDASVSIIGAKASVSSMTYRGAVPKATLTIKKVGTLKEGTDYTVRYANIGVKGTATAIFTGIGNYSGVLKKTFKVKTAMIADKDVMVAKSAPVQKGGAKPEISVIVDGVKLIMGVDYTTSYKNNKKAGKTATVTIKGKGNYSGKVTRKYQVTAAETAAGAAKDDALQTAYMEPVAAAGL